MSAFDDYLASAPSAPQSQAPSFDAYIGNAKVAPVQDQPGYLSSAGAGLGHGFGSIVLGAQQLLGHGAKAVGLDAAGNWLVNDANAGLQKIDAENAPYSQAHPTVNGTGDVGGQLVATAPTMMVGPEYAALKFGGKVALSGAQGAAGAALLPTDPSGQGGEGDYWKQKGIQAGVGTLFGTAVPTVISAGKGVGSGVWNAVRPIVSPEKYVGEGITGMLSPEEAASVASNIRSAPTYVPGSLPTTAQAGAHPLLVQTEKAAGNIPEVKTGLIQRAADNNQARWNALMGVAQTPEALDNAIANRTAVTQPLYDAAADQTANVGKAFLSLAQRPAVQQAMQQAEQLAKNRGETLVWPQQGGDMAISGRALDYTKQALSDMVTSAKASGNKSLAAGISDALDQLNSWTQRYIPAQRQAARTFAQMSPPINTMQAGQQIANSLGTRNMISSTNGPALAEIQLNPYRSALMSALTAQQPYGIDSGALGTLQGIGQDLQRQSLSNSVRSPGSDTAYNIAANGWLARQLYGKSFEGATGLGRLIGAATAVATGHPYAGAGILAGGNKVGQMVGHRLNARLAGLLLDPNSILPYLDSRATSLLEPVPQPLVQGLLNYGRPAAVNAIAGASLQ